MRWLKKRIAEFLVRRVTSDDVRRFANSAFVRGFVAFAAKRPK